MDRQKHRGSRSVLAIVLALLVIAASISIWQYSKTSRNEAAAERDAALRMSLAEIRNAIRDFHATNQRYPRTLDELVPTYLPRIPIDPVTGSADTWSLVTEETVSPDTDFQEGEVTPSETYVLDVRSGAGPPWSEF